MASASAYRVDVGPENTGLWRVKQTEEAARKVSELLQDDMRNHHVFFNDDGFHNHIPHHLLALYGTSAPASSLTKAYANNATYQRPALPPHDTTTTSKTEPLTEQQQQTLFTHLGDESYYPDFLTFFQSELSIHGLEKTLTTHLFSRNDMFTRLFAGFLHPLIQLMYGLEWSQDAIVAEALAQTAVHGDSVGWYLLEAERRASAMAQRNMGSIASLLEEVAADEKVAGAARMEDANKIRDGVLRRAKEEMVALASKVVAREDEVEERTAEMFEACVVMGGGAALREGKREKFDFFLMHHINASPIFATFNSSPWIPVATKARLLEAKIRMDLIQYAARGVPPLPLDKLLGYQGRKAQEGETVQDIIARLHEFLDDGHAIKLGRAAVICRDLVKPYAEAGRPWVRLGRGGDEAWRAVCHLIVDSVEAPGPQWVRSCGFEEAWKDVPDANDPKL